MPFEPLKTAVKSFFRRFMQTAEANFVNDAQPKDLSTERWVSSGSYAYNRTSKYLFLWSRLLQSCVSQAGTFILTGRYHDGHCSIYKSEGGCRIDGVGELVLGRDSCHFDHCGRDDEKTKAQQKKLAGLISHIVLTWNPNDPIDSMLQATAEYMITACPAEWNNRRYDRMAHGFVNDTFVKPEWKSVDDCAAELRKAIEKSSNGGVFGGDALSSFFDWNPFSKQPKDRPYERFCLVRFDDFTEAEVDQKFADEDTGEALLGLLQEACRKLNGRSYSPYPLCCSPRRGEKGLRFWVNTGSFTQIDGWKTQEELEAWLANPTPLVRDASYGKTVK